MVHGIGASTPDEDTEMADFKLAQNAANFLGSDFKPPFFLSVGFFRPHVPLFAPPCWFQKYDIEAISLPHIPSWDLDDVPKNFLNINSYAVAPTHAEVLKHGKQRGLTQAYLASISFVDSCVGLVVDALRASPHAENTYVVLWSDHGFHLGEKNHWAKRTLWEESTRVPLLISGPGISPGTTVRAVSKSDRHLSNTHRLMWSSRQTKNSKEFLWFPSLRTPKR